MFEPIPWDNWQPAGFKTVPGGDDYRNRSILAYHYYYPPDVESIGDYMRYRMMDVQR